MKKLAKTDNLTIANQLQIVQNTLKALEVEEKKLKEVLLESLKKQGVKSVKLENGTQFIRAEKQTLTVKPGFEEEVQLWSEDFNCMKLDTAKALKILRRSLKKPPKWAAIRETEYLTIRTK